MDGSLAVGKRDINWVRNLPEIKELIARINKVGAFGRSWTKCKDSPLYGSHILLMNTEEVVSVFGREEPFSVIHYSVGGVENFDLLCEVAAILEKNGVSVKKPVV